MAQAEPEMIGNVVLKPDFALLHKAQEAEGGDVLGDRGDAHRRVHTHRPIRIDMGAAQRDGCVRWRIRPVERHAREAAEGVARIAVAVEDVLETVRRSGAAPAGAQQQSRRRRKRSAPAGQPQRQRPRP